MQHLRRHILAGLLLFPLFVLAGCGGGGGGGGGGTTVIGQVIDSAQNDQPVANARVEIGGASTTTDASGAFTLRGARVGSTTAIVTPPGGQPQTLSLQLPITQGSNVLPTPLTLNIGQVRGVVVTPDGQPAGGALVTVIATGDNVTTGASGAFQIDDLPPGTETEITAVLGTASVSRTITIGNGVTEVGELRLVNDPNPNPPGLPNTIVGTVRSAASNAALPGVVVVLLQNGIERERTTTDAAGNYGFYVPVGVYEILAGGVRGTATVSNPAQPVRLDFTIQP